MILGSIKDCLASQETVSKNMIRGVKKSLLRLRDMTSRPNEQASPYLRYSAIIKNKTGHQLLFINQIIYTQSIHSISIYMSVVTCTCKLFLHIHHWCFFLLVTKTLQLSTFESASIRGVRPSDLTQFISAPPAINFSIISLLALMTKDFKCFCCCSRCSVWFPDNTWIRL